jgi:hypothetical protein|tara:strand:+ start:528 stop:725 length:198 start_codon:yes stop_codon:yes gene_type:complete
MWIFKVIKGLGRILLDILFVLVSIVSAAYVLASFGMIGAVILTIPVWYALSWVYSGIQNAGKTAS